MLGVSNGNSENSNTFPYEVDISLQMYWGYYEGHPCLYVLFVFGTDSGTISKKCWEALNSTKNRVLPWLH